MKKPGLMRWEYRDPEVKLFVADGHESWLYTPEDRQVLVRRFTTADLHSTPLQFLLGQGDLRQSYEISPEPGADAAGADIVLRLTPRSPDADYAYAVIRCDAASFDMRRVVIHERTGNTSEFWLSNFRTNVKFDDSLFRFKAPRGVEVVRVDEK
jgi:chaperone LolA